MVTNGGSLCDTVDRFEKFRFAAHFPSFCWFCFIFHLQANRSCKISWLTNYFWQIVEAVVAFFLPGVAQTELKGPLHPSGPAASSCRQSPCSTCTSSSCSSLPPWRRHGNGLHCWTSETPTDVKHQKSCKSFLFLQLCHNIVLISNNMVCIDQTE